MAASNRRTLRCVPRRSCFVVSSANQRSTEPRRIGRREMQMEAWALGQPPVDQRRFVGAVVVESGGVEVGRHGRLD